MKKELFVTFAAVAAVRDGLLGLTVARGLPADRQPGEGQRGEPDDDRDDRFDIGAEDMR